MAASSLFASSAEMADIFALLASSDDHSYKATTEDVVVCGPTSSGDTHVLEATSVRIDGGGLAWKVAADGAVVRKKYRMMCAMLHDDVRNRRYAEAIEKAVRLQIDRDGHCNVLDIGTGFGFLGLVAAKAGATVVGCEMNDAVAQLARRLVQHNNLEARMSILSARSDELAVEDLLGGQRIDLIVTETLDSELLSEGIVPTLRHAIPSFLAPRGVVVPARARVYAELVSVNATVAPCLRLFGSSAVLKWDTLPYEGILTAASHHAPVVSSGAGLTRVCWEWWDPEDGTEASPLLVQADHLKRSGALISLTEPACVHTIDFNKLDDLPERHEASLTVKPGESKIGHRCDGVLLWWRVECSNADTCDESSTEAEAASIGPIPNTPFQDHWHSALYPIGRPLEINRQTAAAVTITMRCNDTRMRVSVERPSQPPQTSGGGKAAMPAPKRARGPPRPPRLDLRLAMSPAASEDCAPSAPIERVWELCDTERTRRYTEAIAVILRDLSVPVVCLDVADGCFLACITAGMLHKHAEISSCRRGVVLSLENSRSCQEVPRRMWRSFVGRLDSSCGVRVAVVDANCTQTDRIREALLSAAAQGEEEGATSSSSAGASSSASSSSGADASASNGGVNLIVAEPFYHCCGNGRPTLSALQLYYQCAALQPLVDRQKIAVVPRRAMLYGVGVRFDDLLKAHGPLGADVLGIDHTPLDEMWSECYKRPMAYHLWQYSHEIVSVEPVTLLVLDYLQPLQSTNTPEWSLPEASTRTETMRIKAGAAGVDAIAVSVAYHLQDELEGDPSPYSKHELFLLPQRRQGDAELTFGIVVEDGALRIEYE